MYVATRVLLRSLGPNAWGSTHRAPTERRRNSIFNVASPRSQLWTHLPTLSRVPRALPRVSRDHPYIALKSGLSQPSPHAWPNVVHMAAPPESELKGKHMGGKRKGRGRCGTLDRRRRVDLLAVVVVGICSQTRGRFFWRWCLSHHLPLRLLPQRQSCAIFRSPPC